MAKRVVESRMAEGKTDMNVEALRLLEHLTVATERQAEYASKGALVGLVGMLAEPRERARAFLANQDIPAAETAVLVEALKAHGGFHAPEECPDRNRPRRPKAKPGTTCIYCEPALANTSPRAKEILAQAQEGERLRERVIDWLLFSEPRGKDAVALRKEANANRAALSGEEKDG